MGRFMIPVCVICGKSADSWHEAQWEAAGGLQDFCPEHAKQYVPLTEYKRPDLEGEQP